MRPRRSVSVIVPWCARPELGDALRGNRAWIHAFGVQLIVVNCAGSDAEIDRAIGTARVAATRLTVAAPAFNKSLALNVGANAARHGTLFFLDCDVILGARDVEDVVASVSARAFATVASVRDAGARPRRRRRVSVDRKVVGVTSLVGLALDDGRCVNVSRNHVVFDSESRSGPGLLAVRRRHFQAVGGFNSEFEGWGWEDVDIIARLQVHLRLGRREIGSATHLGRGTTNEGGPSEHGNMRRALTNYMSGKWRGTLASDTSAAKLSSRPFTRGHDGCKRGSSG